MSMEDKLTGDLAVGQAVAQLAQPQHIRSHGVTYELYARARVVDPRFPGITEGPFYTIPGWDPAQWAALPEHSVLMGKQVENPTMHVIQMTRSPRTRPPVMIDGVPTATDGVAKAAAVNAPANPAGISAADVMRVSGFGRALEAMKAGLRVARSGWNGKGMWLKLQVPDANSKMTLPYIYIEYPAGHPAYPSGCRVPWLASQTDLLSDDWFTIAD